MEDSQKIHIFKNRYDNKTAETVWKNKFSCIRSAPLTDYHKNAVCVVPTVRNSWIDAFGHRRDEHCSIFMITCQGQAAYAMPVFASGSESMNRCQLLMMLLSSMLRRLLHSKCAKILQKLPPYNSNNVFPQNAFYQGIDTQVHQVVDWLWKQS